MAMRNAIAQFLIILAENREAGRRVIGKGFRAVIDRHVVTAAIVDAI